MFFMLIINCTIKTRMDGAGGQVIDGQSFDLLVAINFIIAKNGKINKQNF